MAQSHTAILFPGQGSQAAGMRELVADARPDLIDLLAEFAGADPFDRIDEGTRFQQPAIFAASLAGWERREADPAVLAGHSLGEVTALVAAGALSAVDGVRVVTARARLMDEAARAGGGGMLAVKAGAADVEPVLRATGISLANDNAPRQVVLSGSEPQLAAAETLLTDSGVRSMRLPVSGAFHSPIMGPAVVRFRLAVASARFLPPRLPVVSCITAEPVVLPRPTLVAALTSPVRWVDTLRALRARGVERFLETGPGSVLTGLVRRTLPDADAALLPELEAVNG